MRKRIIEAICFLLFIALLGTANYNRAEAATKADVFQNSSVKNVRISDISRNQVRLEWNGLRYANGYLIKRSKSLNGKYKTIVSWAVNYCIDNTIEEGETYYYKIYGEIYSNQKLQYRSKPVIFKVSPVPDKPKVSIKIVDNQVTFTIQKVNNVDGYRIFMASSEDGEYKAIKTIKEGKSLTYTKTGLDYGKTYYFRICAFAIQHDEGYDGTYNEKKVELFACLSEAELAKKEKRQREGIQAMKDRGDFERYGRPHVIKQSEFNAAYEDVKNGTKGSFQLMRELNMTKSSFYRYKKEADKKMTAVK